MIEDQISVPIDKDPSKIVKIGLNLREKDHRHLTSFLQANADVFAWSASDMSGIDLEVIVYQLNVDTKHYSIRQKKHSFASEW